MCFFPTDKMHYHNCLTPAQATELGKKGVEET